MLVAACSGRSVLAVGPLRGRPCSAVALAASAASYALLLAVEDPPLDARAAVVAAALLVTGELVGWALELAAAIARRARHRLRGACLSLAVGHRRRW